MDPQDKQDSYKTALSQSWCALQIASRCFRSRELNPRTCWDFHCASQPRLGLQGIHLVPSQLNLHNKDINNRPIASQTLSAILLPRKRHRRGLLPHLHTSITFFSNAIRSMSLLIFQARRRERPSRSARFNSKSKSSRVWQPVVNPCQDHSLSLSCRLVFLPDQGTKLG